MNNRRYERFLETVKVSYTILSSVDSTPFEFGEAQTLDISRGGLALLLREKVAVPGLLQLQLRFPQRPYGMFVLGKTVYCTPVENVGKFRTGIKFVGLLPEDLEAVLNEAQDFDAPD